MSLNQLRSLAERDIPLAAAYISNPWITGKFLDIISIFDIGISDNKDRIRVMEDDDFIALQELISQQITEMKGDLETI